MRRLLALFVERGGPCLVLCFALTGAAQAEEVEVTVQGTRASKVRAEPESATTVYRGAQLMEPGVEASDVLARTPGVQVNRTGSSADVSTLSIRGASAAQVPVYMAGIRLNDDVVGVADLSRLPLWMMDRVELYRSAPPLHAGRSGVTGALAVEPRMPSQSEIRSGLLAGTYSTGAAWGGATWQHAPHSATSVSYRRESSENNYRYFDDGGTGFAPEDDASASRSNADALSDDFWLVSRHRFTQLSGARLTFLGNAYLREQGVAGAAL